MCPLVSAPARGFADWQRTGPFDSGVLYALNLLNQPASHFTAIEDVSRFAYLGGNLSCPLNNVALTFSWYSDPLGNTVVGQRTFVLSQNITNSAQLRLPNLGPFVNVTSSPGGLGNYDLIGDVFATNRVHPLEFIPVRSVLVANVSAVLAAGAQSDVYPLDYYAGPVQVRCSTPGASWQLFFHNFNTDGSTSLVDELDASAGNNRFTSVFGAGTNRIRVANNSAAAGTAFLSVTGSLTGAL